jgi:hypothetical protein
MTELSHGRRRLVLIISQQFWYVDETYVNVKGKWCSLYRAIDRDGNVVDSRLSEKRDMQAAKRFDLREPSRWLVMRQSGSPPMDMMLIHELYARPWVVTSSTAVTPTSTIEWSKTTVASNSATTRCVGLEASHQPPLLQSLR